VSAGDYHTCAVTTDKRAYCWGDNSKGALGDGTTIQTRLRPVPVTGNHAFRQISAGENRTCALTTSTTNKIYCWGTGILGNGNGSSTSRTPQLVSGARTYRQVAVGGYHTCAVSTTSKVLCWGYNQYGELGSGAAASFTAVSPVAVAGTLQFLQVSTGYYHSCAVTTTYKAYCWGYGRGGQIGDGKTYLRFTPRAVAGGLSFNQISAGINYTCGVTTGSQAYCWGNGSGMGDDDVGSSPTPVAVSGGLVFLQVDAGGDHTCGIAIDSLAWCWGHNLEGELGIGTYNTPYNHPVPVQ
jgi:alpha-tubulin suppressor-like RCC1 family protein